MQHPQTLAMWVGVLRFSVATRLEDEQHPRGKLEHRMNARRQPATLWPSYPTLSRHRCDGGTIAAPGTGHGNTLVSGREQ